MAACMERCVKRGQLPGFPCEMQEFAHGFLQVAAKVCTCPLASGKHFQQVHEPPGIEAGCVHHDICYGALYLPVVTGEFNEKPPPSSRDDPLRLAAADFQLRRTSNLIHDGLPYHPAVQPSHKFSLAFSRQGLPRIVMAEQAVLEEAVATREQRGLLGEHHDLAVLVAIARKPGQDSRRRAAPSNDDNGIQRLTAKCFSYFPQSPPEVHAVEHPGTFACPRNASCRPWARDDHAIESSSGSQIAASPVNGPSAILTYPQTADFGPHHRRVGFHHGPAQVSREVTVQGSFAATIDPVAIGSPLREKVLRPGKSGVQGGVYSRSVYR